MKATVKIKALSVNDAYTGRKFSTPEKKIFDRDLNLLLPMLDTPKPPYSVRYEFGMTTAGGDSDNVVKSFQDGLARKYKFNDNQIYKTEVRKYVVGKGNEYIAFSIEHFAGEKKRTGEWLKQLFRGVK